jgi:hypothetical protein
MPIILLVGWHQALHLMHEGYWSWRLRPGYFAATPLHPVHVIIRQVPYRVMYHMIRHGYECSAASHGRWLCAPGG